MNAVEAFEANESTQTQYCRKLIVTGSNLDNEGCTWPVSGNFCLAQLVFIIDELSLYNLSRDLQRAINKFWNLRFIHLFISELLFWSLFKFHSA